MNEETLKNKALFRDERLISLVKRVVAEYYGQNEDVFYQDNRKRENVKYRQVVCYVVKKINEKTPLRLIGESFKKPADMMDGRDKAMDHATVKYACGQIQNLMDTQSGFKKEVEEIIQLLSAKSENDGAFWNKIEVDYFYVSLNNIKVIRFTKEKSITFSGVDDETIEKIKQQYFPDAAQPVKELNKTGLYILDRNN